LKKPKKLPSPSLYKNIIVGLFSLHKEKTIHRDIKPENILINAEGRAFLSDVGVAKQFENTQKFQDNHSLTSIVGTTKWMAPEMILRQKEKVFVDILKTDIFSLGLLALQALDFKMFQSHKVLNEDSKELFTYLRTLRFNHPRKKMQIPGEIPREKVPLGFYYFLRCILSYDIQTRPSVQEVYKDTLKFFYQFEVKNNFKKYIYM
jgi:serine/threonine protein kinase